MLGAAVIFAVAVLGARIQRFLGALARLHDIVFFLCDGYIFAFVAQPGELTTPGIDCTMR
jgi:hypothetical protein